MNDSSAPLLVFDTATDHMSIAVQVQGRVWTHEGPGGAQASVTLIAAILALLAQAQTRLQDLVAIGFGRGPGAFTGLRAACSVAQGLAFGAGLPVLPIDSLGAVAEDARLGHEAQEIWVAMDARMAEIYAACYVFDGASWKTTVAPALMPPAALNALWQAMPPQTVAGSALGVFGGQLKTGAARLVPSALPRGRGMLPLAQQLWMSGGAVAPALALPLYLRDKVAQTTLEREQTRLAREAEVAKP